MTVLLEKLENATIIVDENARLHDERFPGEAFARLGVRREYAGGM